MTTTKQVSIITGGAGGIGTATAKIVGRDHVAVLADVRQDRLDATVAALGALGYDVEGVHCDVNDQAAVAGLFDTAAERGPIASVIHAAGVSPSMGDADYVLRTNMVGTVNVNEAFYAAVNAGAAIVNLASMAAHMIPEEMVPRRDYALALADPDAFLTAMNAACGMMPEESRSALAYTLSKNFVVWYGMSQAERFGGRELRIVSVSPGNTDTDMGRLEARAGSEAMLPDAAVPRWGTAEEMAELLAFCASTRASFLTGTDILNDGGFIASMRTRAEVAPAQ